MLIYAQKGQDSILFIQTQESTLQAEHVQFCTHNLITQPGCAWSKSHTREL
mgnify:CR=1 FL=1